MKTAPAAGATIFGVQSGEIILVITAHPDDFEMFFSTGMRQAKEAGALIVVAVATIGEATTHNYADPDNPRPADTSIKEIRLDEARQAFKHQNIPTQRQEYFNLPDGRLSTWLNHACLGWKVIYTVLKHHATKIVIPGPDGMDKHADHIAVHEVTLGVGKLLHGLGRHLEVWALTNEGAGDSWVDVDRIEKEALLAYHHSQFPFRGNPKVAHEYADRYSQLLKRETYIRVL